MNEKQAQKDKGAKAQNDKQNRAADKTEINNRARVPRTAKPLPHAQQHP